ncbi:MAG TPA: M56 family metallopeptidase [Thermoanaerobaculia bacterium]|nr:M56 family metallopeptidase [Thermoanaerobaculia bacterium]
MNVFLLLRWILDATLKGSVLILIVALVQYVIGRSAGARWRHALWLLVLLRLAFPAAPASRWSLFNLLPAEPRVEVPRVALTQVAAGPRIVPVGPGEVLLLNADRLATVWRWILAVWVLGVAALLLRSIVSALRIRRALNGAPASAGVPVRIVDDARARLGIGRRVRVVECDAVDAPALHGLIHPVLLLPRDFSDSFSDGELRHVVLHELWHLRRFDVVVNWILAAVEALHWFNPLVWFAVSRIREERELACDELALSCLEEDERLGYGRTILKLLERFRVPAPIPALVGIVNHKQKMKRRLLMIANYSNRTRFSILFAAAIALVGVAGLTDARGGERHMMRKLNPAAMQTMEKLSQRVTFDLNNASLGDLLGTLSNQTGVVVTQSPGTASSDAQQARFTLHAENVPAQVLLRSALHPLGLVAEPDANGVTVFKVVDRGEAEHSGPGIREEQEHIVMRSPEGEKAEGMKVKKRISISVEEPKSTVSADGTLHRELTFNIEENGVASQGKLVIDIRGATQSR